MKRSIYLGIVYSVLCNLVAWTLLTLSDFYGERTHNHLEMAVAIVLPVIMVLVYICYMLISKRIHANWKSKLCDKGIWTVVSALFSFIVSFLVGEEVWVVKQATGGWEHFLNGIEYMSFGILFTGGCLIAFLIFDGMVALIRYIKNKIEENKIKNV